MERNGDDVNRKLSVVKMRHTNHRLGYIPFEWDSDKQQFVVERSYSTVTDFARFLGRSTFLPSFNAYGMQLIVMAPQILMVKIFHVISE